MAVVGIDHVQLAMPAGREDEARAFYGQLLGISERAKPADLARRGGVWFERGDFKLHLGVEAEFRPAKKAHPALRVEGLSALKPAFPAIAQNSGVTKPDVVTIWNLIPWSAAWRRISAPSVG